VRVLLTAFEPYDQWSSNSSWMALVEMLKDYPAGKSLVTRRYPVNLPLVREKLAKDLDREFDFVLHLGQSPGASCIKLEAIAINAAGCTESRGEELQELIPSGPVGYRSNMPLARWVELLRQENIPTCISYHAGTYLCNAIMYLSQHYLSTSKRDRTSRRCMVGFVHLPLATEQVAQQAQSMPSLPVAMMARAVRILVEDLRADTELGSEQVA
jgi:pyroglutamyl-peptidase